VFAAALQALAKVSHVQVNVHEAKTQLSRLLARVAAGEEVVIAKAGTPVARLVPVEQPKKKRELGFLKGWWVAPDWDSDEVNKEIEDMFYESIESYDPLLEGPKDGEDDTA